MTRPNRRRGETIDRSARHLAILHYVQGYSATQGIPPSTREIAIAIGMSPSVAHKEMNIMYGKGLLKHAPSKARTTTLTPRGREAIANGSII